MARVPCPAAGPSLVLLLAGCGAAAAQDIGTLNPKPLPPIEQSQTIPRRRPRNCSAARPRRRRWQARSIGYYTHGCLAGGVALPINGKTWQVMRLSRNRNWGHPNLIKFLERFASQGAVHRLARAAGRRHGAAARRADADRPLEPSGRARRRHLADADAGPRADRAGARGDDGDQRGRRRLERRQSEGLVADLHRAATRWRRRIPRSSACWSIRRSRRRCAATSRATAPGCTRLRPVFGHNYHFHVRIRCPKDSPDCKAQPATPHDEGCGKDLDWWFSKQVRDIKPGKSKPILMSALPPACTKS